jgi:hypothetical protein
MIDGDRRCRRHVRFIGRDDIVTCAASQRSCSRVVLSTLDV